MTKKNKIEDLEDASFYADDSNETPPADIVAYNELRSCADLFRMHDDGVLEIQPDFQRDIVWNSPSQTRFIDSLIKQLPIPSMCFSFDYKTDKWMVIDGLQRISTIIRFLKGGDWKLSVLEDINQDISGKSVAALKDKNDPHHHYYKRVQNLTIPVTVLRCDFSKTDHMEYLFTIFHRLNSGGAKLNNQEIRNCIYGGKFNLLLRALDQNASWRRINKMKSGENYRLTKQELVLRFFTFVDKYKKYDGRLSKFLNSYMQDNRDLSDKDQQLKKEIFDRTVSVIDRKIFSSKSPPKTSITLLEALLVGVAKNIDLIEAMNDVEVRARYKDLVNNPAFSDELIREGLSKRLRVINRFDAAIKIFSA
ncbi:MAG: DUF262 domain-containing protein [Alphaproteobacteria bacterium]